MICTVSGRPPTSLYAMCRNRRPIPSGGIAPLVGRTSGCRRPGPFGPGTCCVCRTGAAIRPARPTSDCRCCRRVIVLMLSAFQLFREAEDVSSSSLVDRVVVLIPADALGAAVFAARGDGEQRAGAIDGYRAAELVERLGVRAFDVGNLPPRRAGAREEIDGARLR